MGLKQILPKAFSCKIFSPKLFQLILFSFRADFLDVPFQAIECCLSNVVPRGGKAKCVLIIFTNSFIYIT